MAAGLAIGSTVMDRKRVEWAPEDVAMMRQTVAEGATHAQLMLMLEVAAQYDLNPLTKEIWCAVPKNRDGSYKTDRVLIMVGRDGFLKIALRSGEHEGLVGDVVYEKDEFSVTHEINDDGSVKTRVRHSHGAAERGVMIGAWAMARRTGMDSQFFYAPLSEYRPRDVSTYSPWSNQVSAMILKVAETNVLKKLHGITGVLGEGEEARALEDASGGATVGVPTVGSAAALDMPADLRVLHERLVFLFAQANEVREKAFPPGKVNLILSGCLEAPQYERKIAEMVAWFTGKGLEVPEFVPSEPVPAEVESPEAAEGAQEAAAEAAASEVGEPADVADRGEEAAAVPAVGSDGPPEDDYVVRDPEDEGIPSHMLPDKPEPEPAAETPWERRKRLAGATDGEGTLLGEELG